MSELSLPLAKQSFAWPTPPLAAYPLPVCVFEPEPCEIEGRTGHLLTGLMVSFEPEEGLVRVQVPPERAPMTLRFTQLRRITLKRSLVPMSTVGVADAAGDAPDKVLAYYPSQTYSVQLTGGASMTGRTVGQVEIPVGLFLFAPIDGVGSVQRIFVPRGAIEQYQIGDRLGQILLDQQATTPEQIEQVLALQQAQRQKKLGEQLLERQVVTPEQLLAALDKQARMPSVRLGEALLRLGYLSDKQLQDALHQQRADRTQPLGALLLEKGLIEGDQLRVALACKMGYPVVDVASFPVNPSLIQLLSVSDARRLQVLPLMRRGGRLVVAMHDASQEVVIEELQHLTQTQIAPTLASGTGLAEAIERAYSQVSADLSVGAPVIDLPERLTATPAADFPASAPRQTAASAVAAVPVEEVAVAVEKVALEAIFSLISLDGMGGEIPATGVAPAEEPLPLREPVAQAAAADAHAHADADAAGRAAGSTDRHESPMMQTLANLVIDAIGSEASSVQIETVGPDDSLQIRLRRNGRLEPHTEWPAAYRVPLIARIKALSDLDVSETRRPQEGRLAFGRLAPQYPLNLRVQVLPTQNGLEDVVLSLPPHLKPMALDALGMTAPDVERMKGLLNRPAGLILCVGPARSGRTTSLHASLAHLIRPDRRIWTLEDRIELVQPGLRQMQVHLEEGQTYESGLRTLLNTDADVLMVGHIADVHTARMAVDAALQGRLVLGAMTGRNACDAVMRLMDQGVTPWDLSDALLGVHSQRLLRRMCSTCRMSRGAKEGEIDEWVHSYFDGALVVDPVAEREALLQSWLERFGREGRLRRFQSPGCERCAQTGLRGRLAVHELLVVTRELRRLIRAGVPAWNLERQALKDGMRSLRQEAIDKMVAGQITLDEVRTVADV
jgi:type II secretory ATPase GspE/PulE/Tfp pilus assembly ATPase PilB-like protein